MSTFSTTNRVVRSARVSGAILVAAGLGLVAGQLRAQAPFQTKELRTVGGLVAGSRVTLALGDFTGDGVPEFLVGVPDFNAGRGRVVLIDGAPGGAVLQSRTGIPGAQIGTGFAVLGDVNGDGVGDYASGNIFGSPDGVVLNYGHVAIRSGGVGALDYKVRDLEGLTEGSRIGTAIALLGDLDGDGHVSIAVGSPGWDSDRGRVDVFDAVTGALERSITGTAGAKFGSALAAHDVDGDGLKELIVGGPALLHGDGGTGRITVWKHGVTANIALFDAPSNPALPFQQFGRRIQGTSDLDGDGFADLLIGADRHVVAWSPLSGAVIQTIVDQQAGPNGLSLQDLGDLNGDGKSDFAVGNSNFSRTVGTTTIQGRVTWYSGANFAVLAKRDGTESSGFGQELCGGFDLDGDGRKDLVVAAVPTNGANPYLSLVAAAPIDLNTSPLVLHPSETMVGNVEIPTGQSAQGAGRIEGRVTVRPGASFVATGPLTIGDENDPNGVVIEGVIDAGGQTVELKDANEVVVDGEVRLAGGVVKAPNGIRVRPGGKITGRGAVEGKVEVEADATVEATGDLTIGDESAQDGVVVRGKLRAHGHVVTVKNPHPTAVHGEVEVGGGVVKAPNGVHAKPGGRIVGYGAIDARVETDAGSSIELDGDLELGSPVAQRDHRISGEVRVKHHKLRSHDDPATSVNGPVDVRGGAIECKKMAMDEYAELTGHGAVEGKVDSQRGSKIKVEGGDLSVGTETEPDAVVLRSDVSVEAGRNIKFKHPQSERAKVSGGSLALGDGSRVVSRGMEMQDAQLKGTGRVAKEPGPAQPIAVRRNRPNPSNPPAPSTAPGHSPGTLEFELDVVFDDPETITLMELAGTSAAQVDRMVFLGDVAFGGVLNVVLLDLFEPAVGDQFDLFDFSGAVTGAFHAINLPSLPPHLLWDADHLSTTGVLAVVAADQTPPVVVFSNPVDGFVTNQYDVAVAAVVADEAATTVASSPLGLTPESLPAAGGTVSGTLPLAAEGSNAISVSATDASGNAGGTSVLVYRDTAAPTVEILPAEGTIVSMPITSFTITVTDQTALSVSIDGGAPFTAQVPDLAVYGASSLTLPGTILLWSEGVNAITVQATDAGGNVTTVTRTVILDSTAPAVEITSPTHGACFGAGTVNPIAVSADVNDATATEVTGALGGSLAPGGGTLFGTFMLQEGVNVISVSARDNGGAGNVATDTFVVTLDTILPVVTITSPAAGAFVRGTIEAHSAATDAAPGTVVATAYFVDDVPLPAAELQLIDTTTLSDGPHVLRVDAFDGCGNVGSSSITVVVDNTRPTLTISNPVDMAWVAGTAVPFNASASDGGTGLVSIAMKAAGLPPATDGSRVFASPTGSGTASSFVDTVAASNGLDGDMEFVVTAKDAAGNETVAAITVRVDNTAPDKAITSPADGATVRCKVDVAATVLDPNLAGVRFVVDGVATPTMTTPPFTTAVDTRNRLDGDMTITLVAVDTLGNTTSSTIHVEVDNQEVKIEPETLELKSRGGSKSVTAKVEGQNAALLLGPNPLEIMLCVPGGSPIPATVVNGHEQGWLCACENHPSHRGHRNGHEHRAHGPESKVQIKFDRQLLIGALRASGQVNGKVEVTLKVVTGGRTFEIGSDVVKVKS